jgi:iron complex transport system substrate-binding protein
MKALFLWLWSLVLLCPLATAQTITVTDLAGRPVSVRAPAQRVILGEGRQLYLVAMLDSDEPLKRIVGWRKDLIQADPDTYAQYRRRFPGIADIATFGGVEDGTFDLEQAIALRPDLVLLNVEAKRATEDARYVEKLAALGIAVAYIDFRHRPFENTEATIRLVGRLFGRQARAEEIIAFRREEMRRVTSVIEAAQPARPKVFIERIGGYTQDCCLTFGRENVGRLVDMAGGDNIAGNLVPGTFGQLNAEQIIAADPAQVIVTSGRWDAYVPGGDWVGVGPGADLVEAERKLRGFTRKPAYTGTAANRSQAFHAMWHQFYNSPYQFVALQQIAVWLHPQLFVGLDADATFRTLHERFLPIPYEAGYFVSLKKRAAPR